MCSKLEKMCRGISPGKELHASPIYIYIYLKTGVTIANNTYLPKFFLIIHNETKFVKKKVLRVRRKKVESSLFNFTSYIKDSATVVS